MRKTPKKNKNKFKDIEEIAEYEATHSIGALSRSIRKSGEIKKQTNLIGQILLADEDGGMIGILDN